MICERDAEPLDQRSRIAMKTHLIVPDSLRVLERARTLNGLIEAALPSADAIATNTPGMCTHSRRQLPEWRTIFSLLDKKEFISNSFSRTLNW